MIYIGLVLIACLFAGCAPSGTPEMKKSDSPMLVSICSIVAEHLELTDIDPESTFATVGADDLDLVEITMEVEERFDIVINDDALLHAAGTSDTNSLCDHLTIRTFATIAEQAPKRAQQNPSPAVDDGKLHESQVGAFGELSKLPNPDGLVLVFIPDFEELAHIQEQRLGRELFDAEFEALRQKAAVIALPQDVADKMKQRKSERDALHGKP